MRCRKRGRGREAGRKGEGDARQEERGREGRGWRGDVGGDKEEWVGGKGRWGEREVVEGKLKGVKVWRKKGGLWNKEKVE